MKSLIIAFFVSIFSLVGLANPTPVLKSIKTDFMDEAFVGVLTFNRSLKGQSPKVEFINQTIQIDIPGAKISERRRIERIRKNKIKSLYVYQSAKNVLRARIIYSGVDAIQFKNLVDVFVEGKTIRFQVNSSAPIQPQNLIEEPRQEIAKNLVVTSPLSENKPIEKVSLDTIETQSVGSDSLTKILLSVFVLSVLFVTGLWLLKNFLKKKGKIKQDGKIQILTQHYLGPKKSLAIIRVAGETILIGITDQNINMIKSLALMDEEISGLDKKDFGDVLRKENVYGDFDSLSKESEHVPDHLDQDDLDGGSNC